MNKKTSLSIALSAVLGSSNIASADTISMSFTGAMTSLTSTGLINANSDAQGDFDFIGSRTAITGTGTFDTATGTGSAQIDSFSFFGSGLMYNTSLSFQAIGDGMGGTNGSLIAAVMGFNWAGGSSIPVTAVFDVAGFFNSIGAVGTTWTVGTDCVGCATSATPDTLPFLGGVAIGAVPMALTTWDTAGITMETLFPLSDAPTEPDAIAGVPMTTFPFPGATFAYDFTSITATNVPQVPIPSAVWLFGSGLIGLIGIARRKKS